MKIITMACVAAFLNIGLSFADNKASLPESAIKMNADEVKNMAYENTASGDSSYGRFAIYFDGNGRLVIYKPDSGKSDTGIWHINSNGELCTVFDHWAKSKEKCRTFYKVRREYWGFEGDKVHKYQQIRSGNHTGKST